MNKVQKRFFEKIAKPVFVTLALIVTGILAHVVSSIWGYTLAHVLVAIVYISGAVLIVGFPLLVVASWLERNWQEAKQEVTHDRYQFIEILRND